MCTLHQIHSLCLNNDNIIQLALDHTVINPEKKLWFSPKNYHSENDILILKTNFRKF